MVKNSGSRTSSLGVYGITVAAELVGVGEQTLRLYERKGLLEPSRTAGGTRRYSEDDLQIVRRVIELLEAGVNLVGIRHVLELETENRLLRAELDRLSS
ncbi:MerR family transcriptional regulator [Glutamicibacter endophyticus]